MKEFYIPSPEPLLALSVIHGVLGGGVEECAACGDGVQMVACGARVWFWTTLKSMRRRTGESALEFWVCRQYLGAADLAITASIPPVKFGAPMSLEEARAIAALMTDIFFGKQAR